MADRREGSQLLGDFCREGAVLVAVLWPLEVIIKDGAISGASFGWAEFIAAILLYWGIILEGRDEL